MDDELFDVFDEPPQRVVTGNGTTPSKKAKSGKSKKDKSKKRKADAELLKPEQHDDVAMADGTEPTSDEDHVAESPEQAEGHSKRRKKESEAEPVLTDTFQTAELREVAPVDGFAPVQETENIVLSHNIQHQVALPPDLDYEYVPLSEHKPPEEPTRVYPFKLDPFQTLAINSIERDESVLVAAHTSAGKTVVAEYAIAQCLKNNQRVIYTSPIKALSNQKFRDFKEEFGDVGLMTGDTTQNPSASCLVMTTEILRSMLYRGSEIVREVGWVIFDEIHYLRDKTRGVVWEEAIILLPDKVRYVFLSATIPNAFQFAEWIAKIHRQACHVVYTDFRPTPLQNYCFPSGHKGLYLIVDERGNFKEKNFNTAMAMIEANKGGDAADPNARQQGKGKNKKTFQGRSSDASADIYKVIKMIVRKSFNPVIVFNFSKRECEELALKISAMNFNNETEKPVVDQVYENALRILSEEDRELPQITQLLPLLRKGIGVHHSGLLPILKEMIEVLFQEGLIKVLFATETFSIGLNMPARTVVFTQVQKFDGKTRRPLTATEYVQMSGRAGRRGLDDRGIVIMMVDDKLEPETVKEIVAGQQDRLNSAFYLGYNMILNLQRIEPISPEYMLERCFLQFQTTASVPTLEREIASMQQERDGIVIADEATVKEYHHLRGQIETYTKDMEAVIQQPAHCLEFMAPGRLVHIKTPEGVDFDWGVVVGFTARKAPKPGEREYSPQESFFVDVALSLNADSDDVLPSSQRQPASHLPRGILPQSGAKETTTQIVPCLLTCISSISQLRIFMPEEFRGQHNQRVSQQARDTVTRALKEVQRRFPDGVPILDPIENMGITDESFKKLLRKIEVLESRLLSNPLHGSPRLPELWEKYNQKTLLSNRIKEKKKAITKAVSVSQMDELKSRMRVLRRLGFIDDAGMVQLKGRVACEISSTEGGHELLISELLLNGFFNPMPPALCAAVLTVFICDERTEPDPLKEDLAKPYREILAQARIIAKVSQESKLDVNEEEYLKSLRWGLMEVTYEWAKGRPFAEIW